MHKWLLDAVRNNKWSVWMLNREGQWVRIASNTSERIARKEYDRQPRGYAYRLYDNLGNIVDSKGDDTVIVS